MKIKLRLLNICFLCLAALVPAQAQKWGNLSKAGRTVKTSAAERALTAPANQFAYTRNASHKWLDELERFVAREGHFPHSSRHHKDAPLYVGISNVLRTLDPQDPIAVRIREIRQQYPSAVHNTPQQWLNLLEEFVTRKGRLPHFSRTYSYTKEAKLAAGIRNLLKTLDEQDPIAVRIREIKTQYNPIKTPQQWLDALEDFTAYHHRFPIASRNPREYDLNKGVNNAFFRLDPQDPIAVRIRQLREQYPSSFQRPNKTPQQWLDELENFIQTNHHFPLSTPGKTEYLLYSNVMRLATHLDEQDPVALRIRELRAQYPSRLH